MGLIRHKLRTFVRTNFAPIDAITAAKWSRRLKIFYSVLAWNIFGFVIYQTIWKKSNEVKSSIPSSIYYAKQFDISNARVVKVSGFNVETNVITQEDIEKEYKDDKL